jgi:hypothetical protein
MNTATVGEGRNGGFRALLLLARIRLSRGAETYESARWAGKPPVATGPHRAIVTRISDLR